ncbi:hypothetical protein CRE_28664 [Caenorhabditis remanei]|uniref:Uncharacterized protein n=1 Tax=Caenorhabditis remanei TaxID=31234 RepID=E3MJX3_CAERE|nr:hypothetical protein CRE_28664 [Caenorhabditis remanei]
MKTQEYLLFCFLTFYFIGVSFAQLAKCAEPGCPANGVWGEWKNDTKSICNMTCGGCGTSFQTRECLSTPVCNCTGNSHRYIGCNFGACEYPTQKTCCPPYLPMVINGVYMCGPVPKTIESTACCPQTDLFSPWTGWQLSGNMWSRTRKCIAESIGCPCTAASTQTQTQPPCGQPGDATEYCKNIPVGRGVKHQDLVMNDGEDSADLVMIGKNQDGNTYCQSLTDKYGAGMEFEGVLLIMQDASGVCTTDTVFDCSPINSTIGNATFTCNGTSGNWIYDYTGKEVIRTVIGSWV